MKRRYVTVDVFTTVAFGGNPLAVVLDADGLSTDDMQTIAREFNYSETTFVLPPESDANTANVRIFTPAREMPFAGHPNVGTAFVLAREGSVFGTTIGATVRFEELAGLVAIDLTRDNGGPVTGALLTAPQAPEIGQEFPPDHLAACVGLVADDIVTTTHAPVMASTGMAFPVAELASLDALRRAVPNTAVISEEEDMLGHVYVYVRDNDEPHQLSARMFAPGVGIYEDPATGSAAAALTGLLGGLEGTDGTFNYRINQGVEMGRPSLIETAADVTAGKVSAVRVGGHCVEMMRGELDA